MDEILNLVYFEGEPLKSLIAVIVLSMAFEFCLSFAYILRSTKNGVSI